MTIADDLAQRTDDVGFGFKIHGQVGMIPVTQNPQTDKVFLLAFNLLGSIFTAFLAELCRCQFLTRFAIQLLNLQFDRQTVTVPAWNIRRIKASHPF
ncbi:hypothetical protein D3C79_663240 [compost metagenome]